MASHSDFERKIRGCRACPRLVAALAQHRQEFPQSHSAPVPASGPTRARLLIIGLAPGRQGANRTGRVFVGDASGRFLFRALHHSGLATDPDPFAARLSGVRITNVLKCWPPRNKPQVDELQRCGKHLQQELSMFWHTGARQPRGILCLGRIAYASTCAALQTLLPAESADLPGFQHGHSQWLTPTLRLVASYHPSAQNVNTGRLNAEMFDQALASLLASQR